MNVPVEFLSGRRGVGRTHRNPFLYLFPRRMLRQPLMALSLSCVPKEQFYPPRKYLRRRKWQPTPVFSPGESQGQQSLVGCRLWNCTESDTTEATEQQQKVSDASDGTGTLYFQEKWQSHPDSGISSVIVLNFLVTYGICTTRNIVVIYGISIT